MVRSPRPLRPAFARLLVLAAFAGLTVGCSDSKPSAATLPPATDPAPTVAVTDTAAPDTTAAAATTAPTAAATTAAKTPATTAATTATTTAVTDPPASGPDLNDVDWLAVFRVTKNNGYFTNLPVLARNYHFTCDDRSCGSGTIVVSSPGGESFGDEYNMGFTFDGGHLVAQGTNGDVCLDPATGQFTGPKNSTTNTKVDLTLKGDGFAGTIAVDLTTPASAQCKAEQIGYVADLSMRRADAAPDSPATTFFTGSDTDIDFAQRAVLRCEGSEDCEYKLRTGLTLAGPDNSTVNKQIEFRLKAHGNSTWAGVANYTVPCVNGKDNSFVAADGYDVTKTAVVGWQREVNYDPILITVEKAHAEPSASLTPEQASVCKAFDTQAEFAGLVELGQEGVPTLIDWTVPPDNS